MFPHVFDTNNKLHVSKRERHSDVVFTVPRDRRNREPMSGENKCAAPRDLYF